MVGGGGWKKWGCSKCRRPETAQPDLPEADRRKLRGCDAPVDGVVWAGPPPLSVCPNSLPRVVISALRWWWDFTSLGILPFSGSMADQPAYVKQAIVALHEEAQRAGMVPIPIRGGP